MTVLSGNFPEVCFAKYGSMPLKARYLHEMSLRILLHSIEIAANKYKRHIVPWLSMSVDFYVRVFVRVFESPAEVKNSCMKRAMVLQSTQCPTFYLQPLASASTNKGTYSGSILRDGGDGKCAETGGNLKMAGPFWIAPIHDQEVRFNSIVPYCDVSMTVICNTIRLWMSCLPAWKRKTRRSH